MLLGHRLKEFSSMDYTLAVLNLENSALFALSNSVLFTFVLFLFPLLLLVLLLFSVSLSFFFIYFFYHNRTLTDMKTSMQIRKQTLTLLLVSKVVTELR